jgi:pheromone shutdown protein TraB
MDDASKYWPFSVSATVLMIVGYFPEFVRLYLERSASGTGIFMWLIWIGSASMSTLYAALSGASILIVVNCATILSLTVLSASGNAYFSRRPPGGTAPATEMS